MARLSKYVKLFSNIFCIVLLSYIVTQKSLKPTVIKKITRYPADLRHILIWTKIPGIENDGQNHFINRKCHSINCYFTQNKTLLGDMRLFDGIVFNLQDVSQGLNSLPSSRAAHQKYIFAANDSSDNYPVCSPVYEDFFNWTWTYRMDSVVRYKFFSVLSTHYDGPEDHHRWLQSMKPVNDVFKRQLRSKTKAGVIFLNKCTSRSKREVFFENLKIQLAKYNLTADVFGKCGPKECRRNTMIPCFYKLRKIYFFYLAMEDSLAEDFVTDSVLYGYKYNAVPVVFGKADYQKFLPPHSYIDALSLGEEKLANLMHNLMLNKERYYAFFSWRNHYVIKESPVLDPCTLCQTLNNAAWLEHRASYTEFRKWWNPDYSTRCAFYSRYFAL